MSSFQIIFLTGLALCLIQRVNSIKCYSCESYRHPHCGEPFNKEGILIEDCDQVQPPRGYQSTGKIKYCSKISKIENNRTIISRSCYHENAANVEDKCITWGQSRQEIIYNSCDICDENTCNLGTTNTPLTIISAIIITSLIGFFII